MNLFDLYKAVKTGYAPDLRTMGFARILRNAAVAAVKTLSGALPLSFAANGQPLLDYTIHGNTVQDGTPAPDEPVEVVGCGDRTENLFDKNAPDRTTTGYIKSDGTIQSSTNFSTSGYISINGLTTVTLSGYGGGNEPAYCLYDSNREFISGTAYTGRATITLTVGAAAFIRMAYRNEAADTAMLNAGETAMPYEPHGYRVPISVQSEDGAESVTAVYLDKPLHKIGDYSDSVDYEEGVAKRYVKELVLTGKENFISDGENTNTIRFYTTEIINYLSGLSFCTHFINRKQAEITNGDTEGFALYNGKQVGFRVSKKIGTTTAAWKAYLAEQYAAGTPVKVYYVLKVPETEQVTLPTIPTFDGTNTLDAITAVKPSSMEIKYR